MRVLHHLLVSAVVLSVPSCGSPGPRPHRSGTATAGGAAADTAAIAREIRRLSEAHAKAAAEKDTAKVGTIYDTDVLYLPQNDSSDHGAVAVRALWVGALKVPGLIINYEPQKITVSAAGDVAIERGNITGTMNGRPDWVGHYLYVWQKRGGQWRVTDYIWNTHPAAKKR